MWTFELPTKIRFGNGVSQMLRELPEISSRRIVVVTDSSVVKLEAVQTLIKSLAPVTVFDEVRPNPTVANVDTLTAVLRKADAEVVVAIGGGSSLDTAKASSCLAKTDEQSIRPYHSEGKTFDGRHLPVITLPTTAGTGSEVTPIAVLDDEEKNFKSPMSSPLFYPATAVVDPKLTLSAPLFVTAATALDALSHAIEGYWSKNHQPICDTLAKEAARIIFANLGKVYDNLTDIAARERLAYAALLAGIAFQLPKNAVIHACSFPLSNRFHLAHGAACAFTMEAAIRFNTPAMNGRMEEFAFAAGFDSVETMLETITALKRRGKLPLTFHEAGIDPSAVDQLVRESVHPLLNNNPRTVTSDDLRKIYEGLV
ncbi:iron-containing alcohol dehydrogenase [Planctomycetales bacterium]|nr:iron-containing alcohol dehydrogenase [Planctomycetales bacterium]